MRKFKQSLCSASIALALTTSVSAIADDATLAEHFSSEQQVAAISGENEAYIMIGEQTASEGNDASIDIQGKYVYSDITIDGNDNVATTEQTKVIPMLANMMGRIFITGNDNDIGIIQHGYGGAARVDILAGNNNLVNVEQQHFVHDAVGIWDVIKITGSDNTVDSLTYIDLDDAQQRTNLTIEGDNNTAFIHKTGIRGDLGWKQNVDKPSYLKGNNNELSIELHDTGRSTVYAEFTGDDNIINIEMRGDTDAYANKDHIINMEKSSGSGNTFNINSFGSGGSVNFKEFSGDDNQVTVNNLSGFNNRTIKAFHVGDSNVMNFTFNGDGQNQANIGKTTENSSTTNINIDGSWNNISRLGATGDRNTWDLSITGHSNKQFASKPTSASITATTGNDNSFIIQQTGNKNIAEYQDAGNNRFYETIQTGDENYSSVKGIGDNKRVGVTQVGNYNSADLTIDRTLNHAGDYGSDASNVYMVSQEGTDNIVTVDMDAAAKMYINQIGEENIVDLQVTSFQEGMSAKDVYYDFNQIGNENVIEVDIEAGKWGKQEYNQTGLDNYISWTDEGGGSNTAAIDQVGASNTVYMTVATFGWSERNKFDIDQEGAYNEVDMDVTGNGNGTGAANVWDGYSAGIVIQQDGDDNLLLGNDGFGFTINGNVNALLVEQVGNGNTAAGFIIGNNNVAQMTQIGNDNFASINISAY